MLIFILEITEIIFTWALALPPLPIYYQFPQGIVAAPSQDHSTHLVSIRFSLLLPQPWTRRDQPSGKNDDENVQIYSQTILIKMTNLFSTSVPIF